MALPSERKSLCHALRNRGKFIPSLIDGNLMESSRQRDGSRLAAAVHLACT